MKNPYCSIAADCTFDCEEDILKAEPEYYDDEELDAYRGIAADAYSPEQVEEFEEVMTTMRPYEVHGWLVSLGQRGINLPQELQEQALMLIQDSDATTQ